MPTIVFDSEVATDPYFIWKGLDPMTRLSREVVQSGLGCWLASQLKWIWDDLTEVKTQWYMTRVVGLCAWSWHEAGLRLSSFSKQDSFTAAEFCEFHFSEEARKHGAEEIKDPFWDELFRFKKTDGQDGFLYALTDLGESGPVRVPLGDAALCSLLGPALRDSARVLEWGGCGNIFNN
jgi:hypothetical protein